jgi:hypothetical protein
MNSSALSQTDFRKMVFNILRKRSSCKCEVSICMVNTINYFISFIVTSVRTQNLMSFLSVHVFIFLPNKITSRADPHKIRI